MLIKNIKNFSFMQIKNNDKSLIIGMENKYLKNARNAKD